MAKKDENKNPEEELFLGGLDNNDSGASEEELFLGGEGLAKESDEELSKKKEIEKNQKENKTIEILESLEKEKFYSFFGYRNFQKLSEEELSEIQEKIKDYTEVAKNRWGKTQQDRLNAFNKRVRANIQASFRNQTTKKNFDKELKQILLKSIKDTVKPSIIDDKELSSDEYEKTVKIAESMNLIPLYKEDFEKTIQNAVKEEGARVLTIEEEFNKVLEQKPVNYFIDTESRKKEIYSIYAFLKSKFYYNKNFKNKKFSIEEVGGEVNDKLTKLGWELKNNIELFEKIEFKNYIQKYKLPAENESIEKYHIDQLINRAEEMYDISQKEAEKFFKDKNLRPRKTGSEFILGISSSGENVKASGLQELAQVLKRYPELGKQRIYDKMLIATLNNSGYLDLSRNIDEIIRDYGSDEEAGLIKTIYTLDPSIKYITPKSIECNTNEELGDAIENEKAHYKQYIFEMANPDVFLYLEARGREQVSTKCRSLIERGNSERTINNVILELQGRNKFKINNKVFFKPSELISEDDLKESLVELLKDTNTKFSLWMEEFKDLEANVRKWREHKRKNTVTLTYALETGSPFHFYGGNPAYNTSEFEELLYTNITDEPLLKSILDTDSTFSAEAEHWLFNYQGVKYINVLRNYLDNTKENKERKEIFSSLSQFILERYIKINSPENYNVIHLFPIFRVAFKNKVVDESVFNRMKADILNHICSVKSQVYNNTVLNYLLAHLDDKEDVDREFCQKLASYLYDRHIDGEYCWMRVRPLIESGYEKDFFTKETYENYKKAQIEKFYQKPSHNYDECVLEYLHNKNQQDINSVDKTFCNDLAQYLMRSNMSMTYYISNIKPILEAGLNKGIISKETLEKQKQFFVKKLEEEMVSATYDRRKQILKEIEALERQNKVLTTYNKLKEKKEAEIKNQNLLTTMHNWMLIDSSALVGIVFVCLTVLALFIHKMVSFYSPIPELDFFYKEEIKETLRYAGGAVFFLLGIAIVVIINISKKTRRR